jgi:hypothetical protein
MSFEYNARAGVQIQLPGIGTAIKSLVEIPGIDPVALLSGTIYGRDLKDVDPDGYDTVLSLLANYALSPAGSNLGPLIHDVIEAHAPNDDLDVLAIGKAGLWLFGGNRALREPAYCVAATAAISATVYDGKVCTVHPLRPDQRTAPRIPVASDPMRKIYWGGVTR